MSRILLLDVMDTVVRDPYRRIPAFFGLPIPELWPLVDRDVWPAFERGEIDEAEFLASFFRDRRTFDHAAFLAMIRDGYRFVDGMEELLAELRAGGVPMHALSNYPSWYERIEEKLAVSRYLPWTFVSCRTGLRKPDPEAYLGAARALGVEPAACTFVDDRDANCAAAEAVGMEAIVFRGADALRRDLGLAGAGVATGGERG